jgi:Protein of unknown function (DUF1579)
MKRVLSVAFAVSICLSAAIAAQNPPQPPKPGPELKSLNYFVGSWSTSGETKPGPMGPGGKFSGTDRIEWMPGGFYLVSHTSGSSPEGKWTGLAIYGYDNEKKAYTYDEFNSMGEGVHATGHLDGKVWTWTSDLTMGGKTTKTRFVLTEDSPTAYTMKFEMSPDGNNWSTVMEGAGKKAGGATKSAKKK